jgi:DNA invertase Pin-like site-specific DNA recombinase
MGARQRAAAYVRCSTSEQNLEVQTKEIREYCERRGLELGEVYEDAGISGRRAARPGLDRMLADARRHRFDVLVIVKLDRLARSLAHLTSIAADFDAWGLDMVATSQAFDTSCPSGRLTWGILAVVSEFEADLVRSRTLAGLAEARSRGVKLGRKPVLDRRGRERVRRLRASGRSLRQIAGLVGVSVGTVHAAVRA